MSAKSKHTSTTQIHGTVLGFNMSPRGHIEGALVETSNGPVQINFPKHDAGTLSRSMRVGSTIDLPVELDTDAKDHHLVYWACDEESDASGQIVRLNHALHGAINGYHLEDETFLHIKPDDAIEFDLHVGESVRATGVRRAGPDGVVLEVRVIERIQRLGKRHDDVAPG